MAVGTGYSKVASSGLVFAYDTGDSFNSYIGEPTTNLTPYSQDFSQWYGNLFGNWINSNVTLNASIAPDGTLTGNRFGNGYSRYTNSITATTNTIYTFSVWLKNVSLTGSGVSLYWSFGLNGGLVSYGNGLSVGIGTLTNQWQRFTFTVTSPSSGINQLQFGVVTFTGYGGNNSGQQVDVWGGQVEQKSHMTQYLATTTTSATRSNTQGLLDISGKSSTITLNNSYDSNAMFYFDGTDDQINMDSNASVVPTSNLITVEAVVKPQAFSTNRVFMAYGGNNNDRGFLLQFEGSSGIGFIVFNTPASGPAYLGLAASQQYLNQYVHMVGTYDGSKVRYYLNGAQVALSNYTSGLPAQTTFRLGNEFNRSYYANAYIPVSKIYDRVLSDTEIKQNYDHYKTRFSMPTETYRYYEGANAAPFVSNWNNSTTYTMADFGGIPNVTAHGWSSGPATYTLTLNNLPPHTKVRYRVYWHLVDSLDNETNQLFIMNSSGTETEILRFTKQYNLVPAISVLDSNTSAKWSGGQTYTYRPWAGGAYGQDGYLIVDSGLQNHTANSFTARHVLGADQAQADEAEYLSHVEVLLY